MLQQFGAEVFTVELIGIAVLREFNIIITIFIFIRCIIIITNNNR